MALNRIQKNMIDQNFVQEVEETSNKIGVLSDLTTQEKSSLVGAVNETKSQLAQISINVKFPPIPMQGAKGDGVTDDRPTIQGIIDNLDSGTVFIPAGEYKVSQPGIIINKSKVKLIGEGISSMLFTDEYIHVIQVRGQSTNNRIDNVTVSNLVTRGKEGSSDIKPSNIWTGASGIEIMYANYVTINECVVHQHAYDGIGIPQSASNIVIRNCTVYDCLDDGINPGGDSAISDGTVDDVTIEGNHVYNITNAGVHHSGNLRGARTSKNKIWNCKNAIDFTNAYGVHVTENKLIGGSASVIDCKNEGNGNVIDNNEIIGGTGGSGVLVRDTATGYTITNNKIRDVVDVGISVIGTGIGTNIIKDNEVDNCGSHGINVRTGGVIAKGNKVSNIGLSGIILVGIQPFSSISENTIHNVSGYGIYLDQSGSNGIHNNIVKNATLNALNLAAQTNNCLATGNILQSVANAIVDNGTANEKFNNKVVV